MEAETWDQHKISAVVEENLLRDLYERLVIYDASAQIIPDVAESWNISDNGTVYTFNLRSDVKWSNGDQVHIAPYPWIYYYAVNQKVEKFADPRGLQAMSMVIDRKDLAIELMKEAGAGPDNPIKVEISYNTSENHKATATAIADMWSTIGINVKYNVRDASAHYAHLRDTEDYEVARAGWIGDYSDPQSFLFLVESDNDGFNYGNYKNPEHDALMDKAARITDLVERAGCYVRQKRCSCVICR